MARRQSKLRLQVGGTVNLRTGVYIVRPSDDELLRLLEHGEYANVLCSRQMGKSSLIVRTKARLAEKGYATAVIDVAGYLGTPNAADEWYQGLLDEIAHQLRVDLNVHEWWKSCRAITPNQRLIQFFRDEIAAKSSTPVVIFLDEIDSTIALPYTDDFFVAIRAMYNDRASDPLYEQITFCLVGVATPDELIKNLRTTSYNIGRTIELQDFDPARDDLGPLFRTLVDDPVKGNDIVRTVLRWTGGHPYLTVRLCDQLGAIGRISLEEIDRLINEEFVSLDKLHSDVHFQQVLRFLDERIEDTIAAFALYRRIRNGEQIRDEATPMHIALKLAGIIKRDRYGYLIVRNPIYARVFSDEWVAKVLVQAHPTFDDALAPVPRVIKLSPFDKLLESLHSDRNLAGVEYERLRRNLILFFHRRGHLFADELADKTLDRVALDLEKGLEIPDLLLYCHGVARFVDGEGWRNAMVLTGDVLFEQQSQLNTPDDHLFREQKLECLDKCLQQLLPADRKLLLWYYRVEKRNMIESRRALAVELGISTNALRTRVRRLNERLRVCLDRCLNDKKN